MTRTVLIDATELIQNPIRTGIQRVVRALLRHWPAGERLVVCRFVPNAGLQAVPDRVTALLVDADPATAALGVPELAAMVAQAAAVDAQPVEQGAPILVPEVFFDPSRCAYYRWIEANGLHAASFLAFDFIPWLRPDLLGVRETAALMHYARLLRDAPRVGFISAQTRDLYRSRITRNPDAGGPVFALGGDGTKMPRQRWSARRDTILCIGSIDGRKNQDLVLDAFEMLWTEGCPTRLVLVGRVFENGHVSALAARVASLAAREPRFEHHVDITDAALAELYSSARATIYVSEIEGYGLPPVESLGCGVPVIVAAGVPSIAALDGAGQVRLAAVTPESIGDAVRRLGSNKAAAKLWSEADKAAVPTWSDVARDVADWVRT